MGFECRRRWWAVGVARCCCWLLGFFHLRCTLMCSVCYTSQFICLSACLYASACVTCCVNRTEGESCLRRQERGEVGDASHHWLVAHVPITLRLSRSVLRIHHASLATRSTLWRWTGRRREHSLHSRPSTSRRGRHSGITTAGQRQSRSRRTTSLNWLAR